ncbi:uncharacterized protein BJX67DRAFT_183656 [Aspergillus lucknowensis]|uniref:Uncharacterized protein n=1 Tax=Aspergillus lucknowensis TaxID=176173 RepID=A0ABR4LLH3_9EURO
MSKRFFSIYCPSFLCSFRGQTSLSLQSPRNRCSTAQPTAIQRSFPPLIGTSWQYFALLEGALRLPNRTTAPSIFSSLGKQTDLRLGGLFGNHVQSFQELLHLQLLQPTQFPYHPEMSSLQSTLSKLLPTGVPAGRGRLCLLHDLRGLEDYLKPCSYFTAELVYAFRSRHATLSSTLCWTFDLRILIVFLL